MKFLSKIGKYLLKGTVVLAGLGPLWQETKVGDKVELVSDKLIEIRTVILQVEAVGQALGLPGAQKLTAAAPLIAQVILDSAIVGDRKIADPELFKAGSKKIADGMADVMNSLKDDVDTEDHAA
jgi:hypothetical protein